MSDPRTATIAAIRAALGREALPEAKCAALNRRLDQPKPNVVPARGRGEGETLIDRFVAEAERVNATVVRLAEWEAVPETIAGMLSAANLPAAIRIADDPALAEIPWDQAPILEVRRGPAVEGDRATLSAATAGVAETGTVVLLSGADAPTTLNFLPEVHFVALPLGRIVGSYEDVWARLRGDRGAGVLPRVVNWITGPSRTADIEQTLLLGAHGPRHLHLLLIDDRADEESESPPSDDEADHA
jgi:L-lactate dehydrogenase complex protein LldG